MNMGAIKSAPTISKSLFQLFFFYFCYPVFNASNNNNKNREEDNNNQLPQSLDHNDGVTQDLK